MDSWFHNAACYSSYDLRFFGSLPDQAEVRVEYCVNCNVKTECHDLKMRALEKHGLWGGKTAKVRTT